MKNCHKTILQQAGGLDKWQKADVYVNGLEQKDEWELRFFEGEGKVPYVSLLDLVKEFDIVKREAASYETRGAMFKTSSPWRLSAEKNGAFNDIDDGVLPDYKLTELQSFYNRSDKNGLTAFIKRLY